MGFFRFLAGLLGLALMVGGIVYGILGFWGVSRGSPDAWKLALGGIVAAVIGGALMVGPLAAAATRTVGTTHLPSMIFQIRSHQVAVS